MRDVRSVLVCGICSSACTQLGIDKSRHTCGSREEFVSMARLAQQVLELHQHTQTPTRSACVLRR